MKRMKKICTLKGGIFMPKCPSCGSLMIKRNGPYGEFWGCSKYPNCVTTVSLFDVDDKFDEPLNYHYGPSYGACLRCGELDTLSEQGFCSYCQHMWEKD